MQIKINYSSALPMKVQDTMWTKNLHCKVTAVLYCPAYLQKKSSDTGKVLRLRAPPPASSDVSGGRRRADAPSHLAVKGQWLSLLRSFVGRQTFANADARAVAALASLLVDERL